MVKDTPSSITKESENGEVSTDSQDEEKVTLGDALSMNRPSEAPPTSVEELQNLAGGADIKVPKLDLFLLLELLNVSCALHWFHLISRVLLQGLEAVLDKAVELEDGKKVSGFAKLVLSCS